VRIARSTVSRMLPRTGCRRSLPLENSRSIEIISIIRSGGADVRFSACLRIGQSVAVARLALVQRVSSRDLADSTKRRLRSQRAARSAHEK
jgi:hypothetical protein